MYRPGTCPYLIERGHVRRVHVPSRCKFRFDPFCLTSPEAPARAEPGRVALTRPGELFYYLLSPDPGP